MKLSIPFQSLALLWTKKKKNVCHYFLPINFLCLWDVKNIVSPLFFAKIVQNMVKVCFTITSSKNMQNRSSKHSNVACKNVQITSDASCSTKKSNKGKTKHNSLNPIYIETHATKSRQPFWLLPEITRSENFKKIIEHVPYRPLLWGVSCNLWAIWASAHLTHHNGLFLGKLNYIMVFIISRIGQEWTSMRVKAPTMDGWCMDMTFFSLDSCSIANGHQEWKNPLRNGRFRHGME